MQCNYSLGDMILLADTVMKIRFKTSRRWDMPDQVLDKDELFLVGDVYRLGSRIITEDNLKKGLPIVEMRKGSVLRRSYVYEDKPPWVVDRAVDGMKKQDKVKWNVAKEVVGMRYAVAQSKTWKHWIDAIANSSREV